jgi:predicted RNase H-like nuclease (RuvC/YqgF family)
VLKFKSNIRQLQKNLQATENLKTVTLAQVTKLETEFTYIQRNCNDAVTQANEKSATIDRLKSELNDSQQTIESLNISLNVSKVVDAALLFISLNPNTFLFWSLIK